VPEPDEPSGSPHRSGFVSLVGRPNVGKSSLVNAIIGEKVSIVSNKPQTTRTAIRGVLTGDDHQIVFVDTPGIHKAVTPLGERLNENARATIGDADIVALVIDVTKGISKAEKLIASGCPKGLIVIVNKVDLVRAAEVLAMLQSAQQFDAESYFAVSARSSKGVDDLVSHLRARLPEGPAFYPEEMVSDLDDAIWVAELVREQLFRTMREELPYSIATRVIELQWPKIRCEIVVERDSQKGMVIGKGGEILKAVGTAVRKQLQPGAFLELVVAVDPEWQRKPRTFERFGY
jgi:GTPase